MVRGSVRLHKGIDLFFRILFSSLSLFSFHYLSIFFPSRALTLFPALVLNSWVWVILLKFQPDGTAKTHNLLENCFSGWGGDWDVERSLGVSPVPKRMYGVSFEEWGMRRRQAKSEDETGWLSAVFHCKRTTLSYSTVVQKIKWEKRNMWAGVWLKISDWRS